jgi:hypothetical protein
MSLVKVSMGSGEFQKSLEVYFDEYAFEVAGSLLETKDIHSSVVAEIMMAR